jgi:hypothetical protein
MFSLSLSIRNSFPRVKENTSRCNFQNSILYFVTFFFLKKKFSFHVSIYATVPYIYSIERKNVILSETNEKALAIYISA